MSPSIILETLPDEILMIIVRYSGDILTIFRAFFGLNQRINNILLDKRTHLFSYFLFLDSTDVDIDLYYNSNFVSNLSERLLSVNAIENTQELRRCLESLVAWHINQKYQQAIEEIELGLVQHHSLRMQFPEDELQKIDMELKEVFDDLQKSTNLMKNIKQIQSLVLIKGARLVCNDSEYLEFNLADAITKLLLNKISDSQSNSQQVIRSLVRMFKTLIISNLTLLHNRSYAANGGCVIHFFLLTIIYKCQSFHSSRRSSLINLQYYRAAVDLLLFALQCLNYEWIGEPWWIEHFSNLFGWISPMELRIDQEIFIYTSQMEILKIIFNQRILYFKAEDYDQSLTFSKLLGNLFICNRLDLISTIFHYDEHVREQFQVCWNLSKFVNILTGNSRRRRTFHSLLDDPTIGIWLATTTNLLFILLQKKECRHVKKLFSLSPSLIDRLDEEGNNPLLYVCLQVRGCRERLIEYLIRMGCDGQWRNLNGENFFDALQLRKNKKLLKKLIEQETIHIDQHSGEMKIKHPVPINETIEP